MAKNGLQVYLTQKAAQGQKNSLYSMIQNFVVKHKYNVDMQRVYSGSKQTKILMVVNVYAGGLKAALFLHLTRIFYSEQL